MWAADTQLLTIISQIRTQWIWGWKPPVGSRGKARIVVNLTLEMAVSYRDEGYERGSSKPDESSASVTDQQHLHQTM